MDDEQILEELNHFITSKRPNIISVSLFSRHQSVTAERVRSLMDKLTTKFEGGAEEEHVNKVFYVSGLAHNSKLNSKVKLVRIVNEVELEKVKIALETVIDCVLYGVYKGTVTNPAKLKLEQFEEAIRSCVSLPAEYSPDGNCRANSIRPSVQSASTTLSEPGTSGITKVTSQPSSRGGYNNTQKKKPGSGPASKRAKSQPKLFFAQSAASTRNSREEAEEFTKNTVSCPSTQTKEDEVKNKDSPSKCSDKENTEKKGTSKRSRVQMFTSSESESDAELFDTTSKEKKLNKKSGTTSSPHKSVVTKSKAVINKTGLALDPEDLQNESDGEMSDTSSISNKQRESEDKPRKRRRRKKDPEDINGAVDSKGKSKKSNQNANFGAVKAGQLCNSVKYVDETYLDDEGFLVTEKVLEAIPVSEKTTPADVRPEHNKVTNKKVPSNKNPKPLPKQQSSLLTFFKKR